VDCKETQELLSSYFDHELDLMPSLQVEKHLDQCVVCSDKLKTDHALSNLVRDPSLYYSAPVTLENKIRASLRKTESHEQKSSGRSWQWLAYAASIAVVFLLGWILGRSQLPNSTNELLSQEILASHVRSLMPGHLTDVLSSDQHTVKPWFNGKLDFSPPVRDFATQGFPLVGGRLDYVNHKAVSALVYTHNKHVINVYLWPALNMASMEPRSRTLQGYHMIEWTSSGMTHYVVSDLNEAELHDFVKLLQSP
jgi:anti-sigma factor RsiW